MSTRNCWSWTSSLLLTRKWNRNCMFSLASCVLKQTCTVCHPCKLILVDKHMLADLHKWRCHCCTRDCRNREFVGWSTRRLDCLQSGQCSEMFYEYSMKMSPKCESTFSVRELTDLWIVLSTSCPFQNLLTTYWLLCELHGNWTIWLLKKIYISVLSLCNAYFVSWLLLTSLQEKFSCFVLTAGTMLSRIK